MTSKIIKVKSEVYKLANSEEESIATLDSEVIENLIKIASDETRKRARICLHNNINEYVHQMLIAMHYSNYIRPHKHPNKPESYLILKGEAKVIFFTEDGSPKTVLPLSREKTFYCKVPPNTYHTTVFLTEWVVYLEITKGPYVSREENCVNAPWAPNDETCPLSFINDLKKL